jgi:Domain of unknown function (DUF5667)
MADLNEIRRRADEFARLVDGAAPSPDPDQDPEFADAMELVEAMREAGAVEPRPEFSAALRQRLVDEAAAQATATPPDVDDDDDVERIDPTPLHARRRRGKLIASAAAVAILAGGIGSAAAAQQAIPGDPLYGLKRGLESVASQVSVTDNSRGRRDLSHALARLTEAEELTARNAPAGTISDTLHVFSTQAQSGADHLVASYQSRNDASAIQKIYAFAEEARTRLLDLSKTSTPAVQPAIAEAISTVVAIVQQASKACPACAVPKEMPALPSSVSPSPVPVPSPNTPTQPSDLATATIPAQPPTVQTPQPTPGSTSGTKRLPPLPLPSLPVTTSPGLPLPSLPTLPLPTISLPTLGLPGLNVPGLAPDGSESGTSTR